MQVEQELAIALRAEERRGDRSGDAQAQLAARATTRSRTGKVHRRIADDAAGNEVPAGLELGLHEGHDPATGRPEAADHRPQDELERDERDVDHGELDRLGQDARRQGPGVRTLHRDDPRIGAQALGQLAAADVECVDPPGAALEQDVGEATRRGADVEGGQAGWDRSRTRRARRSACGHPG